MKKLIPLLSAIVFTIFAFGVPSLKALAADEVGTVSVESIHVSRDLHELRSDDPSKTSEYQRQVEEHLAAARAADGYNIDHILFARIYAAKAGITLDEEELKKLARSQ